MTDINSLPPELWSEVISWIQSRRELCNVALVSRNWKAEAERVLYRNIDIYRLGGLSVRPLLQTVADSAPKASHIHRLVMMTKQDIIDLIKGILLIVPNLHWMTILHRGGPHFIHHLPSKDIPFALRTFKTDYRVEHGVHAFLRSQPSIRLLSWAPNEKPSDLHTLPSSDLPNLRAISIRNDLEFIRIFLNPSIRSVDIRVKSIPNHYGSPAPQIRAVRHFHPSGEDVVKGLAFMFPNVTYFSTTVRDVSHHLPPHTCPSPHMVVRSHSIGPSSISPT